MFDWLQYDFMRTALWAVLLLVPLLLAAVACTWIFRVRLLQWLPANCVYALLTALLNGSGHYGIGLRGIRLDGAAPTYSPALAGLMALAILAVLLLTQSTTCSLRKLYRKLKKTS